MDEKDHTPAEKSAAQRKYCKKNSYPMFAPGGGQCWSCGNQIYNLLTWNEAAKGHVTGCPYCHRSFCN